MTLRSNVLTFPGAEAPAQSAAVDFTVVTGGGACGLQYINERGDRDLHCELSHRFSHEQVMWVRKMLQAAVDEMEAHSPGTRRALPSPRHVP